MEALKLFAPNADPASMTYSVGTPPVAAGSQLSVTWKVSVSAESPRKSRIVAGPWDSPDAAATGECVKMAIGRASPVFVHVPVRARVAPGCCGLKSNSTEAAGELPAALVATRDAR